MPRRTLAAGAGAPQTAPAPVKIWPKQATRLQTGAMVLGSALLAVILFGNNLNALWWIIDDHEIMWFLRGQDRVSIAELIPRAAETDIGAASAVPRFRPSYYILRLAETWAWGDRPGIWYASHILMFVIFLFAIWWTASSRIGFWPSTLVALYTASFAYWSDIFASLGAAEAYAVLGLALVVFGWDAIERNSRSATGWMLLLVGTVVAAGAKENFVLLAPVVLLVVGYQTWKGHATWWAWLCSGLAVMWCIWVSVIAIGRVAQAGGDVYGNSVGLSRRVEIAIRGAGSPEALLLCGLLGGFVLVSIWSRRWQPALTGTSLTASGWAISLIALFLSQFVFYNGNWPTGMRYDFPGMLYLPGLVLLILWYVLQIENSSGARWLHMTVTLLAGLAILWSQAGNIEIIRGASAANVRRTDRFAESIERLTRLAAEHRSFPVVFQSNDPWDFEPLISYPRFLVAGGVTNVFYLRWEPEQRETSDFLESLSARLTEYSRRGLPGLYAPVAELGPQTQDCILVLLAGRPEQPCRILVDGAWRAH